MAAAMMAYRPVVRHCSALSHLLRGRHRSGKADNIFPTDRYELVYRVPVEG